ncbi:unnamed protein product [Parnassius apollo]|uniref:(apollo) hypothetical protein n=1 Tax=Parnassius apollo TaxID=110799 RepID=A0A8S3Y010_PARAO|nr:unnamed protein product [Parnassius apollo]
MDKDDEIKGAFYEELTNVLTKIHPTELILMLGDFNACVGRDCDAWPKVLGRHGVSSMNSNGQLLLSLCAQFELTVTNTIFRPTAKHKTTWTHPMSKHWNLIDYAIVRHKDISRVKVISVMRGASCWTDHRLVVSRLELRLRYCASFDMEKLQALEVQNIFVEAISEGIPHPNIDIPVSISR